ncbi:MAG: ABC transporter permease [Pseudothermotoga sp.]
MKKTLYWLKVFLFTLMVALVSGTMIIFLTSKSPLETIKWFYLGPLSNLYFLGNMLSGSIPLMLTGIAAVIAFRASIFNLGLEGQLYFGTFCATFVALQLKTVPAEISRFLVLLTAFFIGGLISTLSAVLKISFDVDELLSSFLIGQALIHVVNYFINGPMRDPLAGLSASRYIEDSMIFSKILPPSDLHTGIFLSVIVCVLAYFILRFSVLGYQIKVVGSNHLFARYSGIEPQKIWAVALFLSGGLAALGGIVDLLGVHGRFVRGFSYGYGFNGIAVAMIARNNPLLVIPSAILFSYLESGAQIASIMAQITPEISKIIQAIIFYLLTAQALMEFLEKRKVMRV